MHAMRAELTEKRREVPVMNQTSLLPEIRSSSALPSAPVMAS